MDLTQFTKGAGYDIDCASTTRRGSGMLHVSLDVEGGNMDSRVISCIVGTVFLRKLVKGILVSNSESLCHRRPNEVSLRWRSYM